MLQKKDGFLGQKAIVIPNNILGKFKANGILNNLYITDIGFYPEAKYHYRARKDGISQYILIVCSSGSGWFELNEKKYTVAANSFFLLPANTNHRYGSLSKNPWSIYWIHFKGTVAKHLYEKVGQLAPLKRLGEPELLTSIKLFEDIYSRLEMGYSEENLNYVNMSLYHYLATLLFSNHNPPHSASLNFEKNDVISEAIRYMQNTVFQTLNLTHLAKSSGYSVAHFSQLFKQRTGTSPIDYFINLKMQKACHYLDFSTLKIKKISSILGYHDPYYFSKVFKKTIGDSPLYYRNRLKG